MCTYICICIYEELKNYSCINNPNYLDCILGIKTLDKYVTYTEYFCKSMLSIKN